MGSFTSQLQKGKIAESLTVSYLNSTGWTVIDAANHRLFQELDIDFVAEKDGIVYTIDSKLDRNDTGNLFIETISNMNKQSPGCIYQSRADFWFYYIEPQKTTYIFRPSEMRAHIETHKYPERYAVTTSGTRELYKTAGVLVPISKAPITQKVEITASVSELG